MTKPLARLLGVLASLALVASSKAQEPARDARVWMPATGSASVTGTVVSDDGSNRPIRGATVTVATSLRELTRLGVTDDAGHFVIADLPAGDFAIGVEKNGYLFVDTGSKPSWGHAQSITLGDGERKTVTLQMMRGASIAGRILDAYGRPRQDVTVEAVRTRLSFGHRAPDQIGRAGAYLSRTDDSGAFRFYGLPPGDFVISAIVERRPDVRPVTEAEILWAQQLEQRDGASIGTAAPAAPDTSPYVASPPAYFPGVTDFSAATLVTVAPREEREGIDFSPPRVTTSRIEGTLLDASGRPVAGTEITIVSPELKQRAGLFGLPASRTDRTGTFRFSGVFPGAYTLVAYQPATQPASSAPTPSGSWARQTVDVNGSDLAGVAMRLQPTLSLSGRLIVDGTTSLDVQTMMITLFADNGLASSRPPSTRPAADGTFAFHDLVPDHYGLRAQTPIAAPPAQAGTVAIFSPPAPWRVKSVIVNGVETIDSGIDVSTGDVTNVVATLTDRRAELSGTLVDAMDRPVARYGVVVFSVDRTRWTGPARYLSWAMTDVQGGFKIGVFRPGEYYVVAIAELDPRDLDVESYIESLVPGAIKITIAEGEKKTQDLKLSGGPPR